VVIEIVHVNGVARGESKDHAPVCAHRHSPEPFVPSFESVEPEAGKIHILLRSGRIQASQNVTKFGHVLRQDTARIIFVAEPF